ncbi:hypothetical protein WP5S18E01_17970 [Enterobacter cloacae]|nr:hypothetical protein WP5S18E01_17970 [Enterobacter cloacae]
MYIQNNNDKLSPAKTFLEAVLFSDEKTLKLYKVSKEEIAGISLEIKMSVAQKLLSSDTADIRAQSKKVIAAEALSAQKPLPSKEVKQATFNTTSKLKAIN